MIKKDIGAETQLLDNPKLKSVGLQKWQKVVLGVLILFVVVSAWAYVAYFRPLTKLFFSLEKTFRSQSAEIKYELKDSNFGVVAKVSNKIETGEMSSVTIFGEGFKIESRVGKTDLFAQADIKEEYANELSYGLYNIDPNLVKKSSYVDLLKIIMGQTWMHWNLPGKWWEDKEAVKVEKTKMPKKEEVKTLIDVFKVVKINKYEKNVEVDGQKYDRIVLGLHKKGLLNLIQDLKNQDVEVKLSQINALKRVVESSNDWDKDLIVYLIDKDGRIAMIDLKMPEIEEGVLNDSVKEGVKENAGLAGFIDGFGINIGGTLNKNKEGKLISLGKFAVSKYNMPTEVMVPESRIEWDVWSKQALEDYRPLIMQFMEAMMQSQSASGQMR